MMANPTERDERAQQRHGVRECGPLFNALCRHCAHLQRRPDRLFGRSTVLRCQGAGVDPDQPLRGDRTHRGLALRFNQPPGTLGAVSVLARTSREAARGVNFAPRTVARSGMKGPGVLGARAAPRRVRPPGA